MRGQSASGSLNASPRRKALLNDARGQEEPAETRRPRPLEQYPILTTRNLLLSLTLAAAPARSLCGRARGAQEESPELAGIVMENDALSGRVTTASGIALKRVRFIRSRQSCRTEQPVHGANGSEAEWCTTHGASGGDPKTMLDREDDISLKSLLQRILDTKDKIEELESEIAEVKSELHPRYCRARR